MRWLVGWSSAAASGRRRRARPATAPCTPWAPSCCGATPTRSGPSATGAPTRCASSRPTRRPASRCSAAAAPPTPAAGRPVRRPRRRTRHLTAWPGSYTAVVQVGRRITVAGDLAGARPVFHTPWAGGTAYATAALPLADLVEASWTSATSAALLACPDAPEALGDGTPYAGVRRIPPGHALILRDGAREITGYETDRLARRRRAPARPGEGRGRRARRAGRGGTRPARRAPARARDPRDPGPVPGMGPAERRAARGAPAPGIGADLSGGSASATLALLAAGLPGRARHRPRHGTGAGERLLAVTFNDLATGGATATPNWSGRAPSPRTRGCTMSSSPAGEEALPYADLEGGPLTDEPGPSLVIAERHRRRLAAGSADHFVGYGARQVLDAHPARLADLLMDRRRRHLLRPVAALARAGRPSAHSCPRAADGLPCGPPARPYAVPDRASKRRPTGSWTPTATASGPGAGAARRLARRAHLVPARARRALADRGGAGRSIGPSPGGARSGRAWPSATPRRARAPAPPSPGTPPTTASSNRPPRSAASGCTPRSSTTRSYAPAARCPRRCGSSRGRGPPSCARVLAGAGRPRTAARAGAPPPTPRRPRPAARACAPRSAT